MYRHIYMVCCLLYCFRAKVSRDEGFFNFFLFLYLTDKKVLTRSGLKGRNFFTYLKVGMTVCFNDNFDI